MFAHVVNGEIVEYSKEAKGKGWLPVLSHKPPRYDTENETARCIQTIHEDRIEREWVVFPVEKVPSPEEVKITAMEDRLAALETAISSGRTIQAETGSPAADA